MRSNSSLPAVKIQECLVESENDLDLALARTANLLSSMVAARVETSSPFTTGHTAILRMVKAINSLSTARSDLARVHGELRQIGEVRGDLVGTDECPTLKTDRDVRLKVVA